MSDTTVRDDDGNAYSLDSYGTQKWLEGHYSGLDQCVGWLEQKAVTLFGQRRRQQATELQDLADQMKRDLRPKMVKCAEEHEREYPWELTAENPNE